MPNYYVGLDLGQRADYTALAVLEEPIWVPSDEWVWARGLNDQLEQRSGWVAPSDLVPDESKRIRRPSSPERPVLALKYLERFELNTPYPAIVKHTATLLARPPLAGNAVLLVDATGVGRPVVDMFDQIGLSPMAITITGGDVVTNDGREYRVPKRDLAMAVQVLLQNRRLTFAAALPLLDVLTTELQNFEVKITKTAHDTYEAWREGVHDDLVLAVALPCWYREWSNPEGMRGFCYSYDTRLRPQPRAGYRRR
jgi:hypothetical protein